MQEDLNKWAEIGLMGWLIPEEMEGKIPPKAKEQPLGKPNPSEKVCLLSRIWFP